MFSNTRNGKKQLSIAVVLPPKASVDSECALGNTEDLKSRSPLRANLHLLFSCRSFLLSLYPPSFEEKRNNTGKLERRE